MLDSSPGFTQVFTIELLTAASMNRQTHTPVLESTIPSQFQTPNPFPRVGICSNFDFHELKLACDLRVSSLHLARLLVPTMGDANFKLQIEDICSHAAWQVHLEFACMIGAANGEVRLDRIYWAFFFCILMEKIRFMSMLQAWDSKKGKKGEEEEDHLLLVTSPISRDLKIWASASW